MWYLILGLCLCGRAALAQPENPVYVDQSPRAWDLLQRARDQIQSNVEEAVRLYQQLLDDYSGMLVPAGEGESDHFIALNRPVLADLAANPALLARYRQTETARARRLLEMEDLLTLAMTRSLTEPGLEAMLRLAQQDLESARFHSAQRWLLQAVAHPDLDGRRAAHAWYLTGLCALYLDNAALIDRATQELNSLGEHGGVFRDSLNRYRETPLTRSARSAAAGDDPARSRLVQLGEPVGQAIWSVDLAESLMARRLDGPMGRFVGSGRGRLRQSGELLTASPAVDGPMVFVNQGHCVLALDRSSGLQIWRHEERPAMSVIDSDSESVMDLNYVTVGGGSLITLTGHAYTNQRSSDGHVLCLDPNTGSERWSVDLDLIGGVEDHENLFPHGRPVVADGLVYLLGRRVTPQHLSGCYVVALSVDDGSLLWSRHVASVGGMRAKTYRRFSSLAHDRGDLYVATPLGAIARLDGMTGRIRWLRRYRIPLNPGEPTSVPGPWASPGPIVRDDRVVCIRPDQQAIVVLDSETGRQIDSRSSISRAGWASPDYLLADDRRIYAIGDELRCSEFDNLAEPVWRLPDTVERAGVDTGGLDDREIVGRVQVTATDLVVPTDDGILLIDKTTGKLRHRIDAGTTGNALAIESQLIVAGADRLDAYMSSERAAQMLRRRLEDSPDDPSAALSLMELSLAVHDLPLAMEAAEAALRAVDAIEQTQEAAELQTALFEMLLEIHRREFAQTPPQAVALYELIGRAAAGREQRLEHLIAHADWLADSDPTRAAEQYQRISSDPQLGAIWRPESGRVRTGADWAADRIAALIAAHGPSVCAAQTREASRRLDDLQAADPPSPDGLQSLAWEYPCTEASARAALLGAGSYSQNGDHRAALAILSRLINLSPDRAAEPVGRLLGAYLSICERDDLSEEAIITLKHAVQRLGDPLLTEGGETVRASSLLANSIAGGDSPRLPQVGDQRGLTVSPPGVLVPRHAQMRNGAPADRALLVTDGTVAMVSTDGLATLWSNYVGSDAPQLLRFNQRDVLLWLGDDPDDPRAVMLDAEDGSQRWTTPRLTDHLDDPIGDLARLRGVWEQMPNGDPFDPVQTVPSVNDRWLILTQRTGGVIAFDLADASTPIWSRPRILEQVFWAGLRDRTLVLAGRGSGAGARSGTGPVVVALDAATGEVLCRVRPMTGSDILWMCFGPLGSIVYATDRGIESLDLNSGRIRWANQQPEAMGSLRAWPAGGRVIFQDRARRLRLLEPHNAVVSGMLPVPDLGEWDPLELQDLLVLDEQVLVHYGQRIICYDHQGTVTGADAVTDERSYLKLLAAADRMVIVSRHRTEQVELPHEAGRRTLRTYRIYCMSENGRVLGPALELEPLRRQLIDAELIDGWLLLSTGSETFALPLPKTGQ